MGIRICMTIFFKAPLHIGLNDYKVDAKSTRLFALPLARLLKLLTHSLSSALLVSLARSTALIRLLARSLNHSGAHGKEIYVYESNASISYSFYP